MTTPSPQSNTIKIVYVLYLASLVFGITGLIGLIVAYVNQAQANEVEAAHFRFQIRTFWISLLIGLVAVITMVIGIGFLIWIFLAIWGVSRVLSGFLLANDGKPVTGTKYWGMMAY